MYTKLIAHRDPATGLPVGTIATFINLGSALVALFKADTPSLPGGSGFRWICLGCGDHSGHVDQRQIMRDSANDHASTCRAIPRPTI